MHLDSTTAWKLKQRQGLLNSDEVQALTGLSYSSLYKMAKADKFPSPRRLGPTRNAWRAAEIAAWLEGER